RIDVSCGEILEIVETKPDLHLDFPALLPASYGNSYREVWTLAMPTQPEGTVKYYDRVVRFDCEDRGIVEEYRPPAGIYLAGEPCLAETRGGKGKRYLICPRWHAHENRSDYVILDPFALSAG